MSSDWRLREAESRRVLVPHLEMATSFWGRMVGLQFRARLPADRGLLLAPSNSIHTFWMRFRLDVVFLDRDGRILQVRLCVRPWRVVLPVRGAYAVVETGAGAIAWEVGRRVYLEGPTALLPQPLRHWTLDRPDSLS
jgi:uncharacterized membrane protein (UPF0127 family)